MADVAYVLSTVVLFGLLALTGARSAEEEEVAAAALQLGDTVDHR